MSLISYRRQRMPHSSDAWLMEWTMLELRDSLSCKSREVRSVRALGLGGQQERTPPLP